MAWQLLAIWGLVIATTFWFVWDVRQSRRADAARLKARAEHFALASAYRHEAEIAAGPPVVRELRTRNSVADAAARRRFIEAMSR